MSSGPALNDSYETSFVDGFAKGYIGGAPHPLGHSSQPPRYQEVPEQQHRSPKKTAKKRQSHPEPAKEHPFQTEPAKQLHMHEHRAPSYQSDQSSSQALYQQQLQHDYMDSLNNHIYIDEHPMTYGTAGKPLAPHIVQCHQNNVEAWHLQRTIELDNVIFGVCAGCAAGCCCCYYTCTVM